MGEHSYFFQRGEGEILPLTEGRLCMGEMGFKIRLESLRWLEKNVHKFLQQY